MTLPKLRHFDDGIAMVVTDLHGEGDAFDHVLETFSRLKGQGKADRLIICGDLIHIRRRMPDHSLRMIIEVMALQERLGEDTVTMLLGNHEMPHIYSVTLAKGKDEFTPDFEHAMTQYNKRDEILAFFRQLPFYATTAAGVLLTHAGATAAITKDFEAQQLLTFDHDALLHLAEDRLQNDYDMEILRRDRGYLQQAAHYTAISGPDDPRLHHLLRAQLITQSEEEFTFLWDVLFARNEQRWGEDTYNVIAEQFLQAVGDAADQPLTALVSGHISTQGGYAVVGDHHLRLSTFAHANPYESGKYLLLDCAKPIASVSELVPQLRSLYV